jgi:plasmid maintenance system antidote protein VapI
MNTEFEEAMKRAQQERDIEMKKVQKVLQALPAGAITKFCMELHGPPLDTVAKEVEVPEQDIIEMIEHKRPIPPKVAELLARHYGWSAKASLERRRKIAEFKRVMEAERQRREDEEKQNDNPKLKQLEELHPIQLFRYFLKVLTPDPVEVEINPPTQLFNDILEGKVKITFGVGMRLGRYYGSCALLLVDYQKLYDDLISKDAKKFARQESKARERERAARKRERASDRREGRRFCAELRRQLRAKGDR